MFKHKILHFGAHFNSEVKVFDNFHEAYLYFINLPIEPGEGAQLLTVYPNGRERERFYKDDIFSKKLLNGQRDSKKLEKIKDIVKQLNDVLGNT